MEKPLEWVVFSYSLPAQAGSGPRVALWRRLRRLGAVNPAGGVQVLPAKEECVEAFQWLAQEIRQAQGEAVVMRVDRFEGMDDRQLRDLFCTARQEDYAEVEAEALELQSAMGDKSAEPDFSKGKDVLARLRRKFGEIFRVDYFNCPAGERTARLLDRIEQELSPSRTLDEEPDRVDLDDFKGRRWVTRPRPYIDRLACAWLIRRFIDPQAAIHYDSAPGPEEIAFDIENGSFGHRGNRCTFEVMVDAFGLNNSGPGDRGLRALAEIVHEIDLRDDRYNRPEAPGVEAILSGWHRAGFSDTQLEENGAALFEGLYVQLSS